MEKLLAANMEKGELILLIGCLALIGLFILTFLIVAFKSFKKCPPDKIIVVHGIGKSSGKNGLVKCQNGGVVTVLPFIQAYSFMDINPLKLKMESFEANTLDKNVAKFEIQCSVGIGVEPNLMLNAAEHLLGLMQTTIMDTAKQIIKSFVLRFASESNSKELTRYEGVVFNELKKQMNLELNKLGLVLINSEIKVDIL